MKNKFEKPELNIIYFLNDDVIRTSGGEAHANDPIGEGDDDSGFNG